MTCSPDRSGQQQQQTSSQEESSIQKFRTQNSFYLKLEKCFPKYNTDSSIELEIDPHVTTRLLSKYSNNNYNNTSVMV